VAAYQRGVQERLRQAEKQRAAAEATAQAQRRLVLVVLTAVLAAAVAGGWYWQEQTRRQAEAALQRTRAESEATAALREAATYLEGEEEQARRDPERWQAQVNLGEAAVHRAEMAIASAAVDQDLRESVLEMRTTVDAKRRDSTLRVELDHIRLEQANLREGHFDFAAAVPRYRAALSRYGVEPGNPQSAGAVLRGSGLRGELLAALADWARYTPDKAERQQLAAVLAAAKPEVESWRVRWWSAVQHQDGAALAALVSGAGELAAADLVKLAADLDQLGQGAAAERLLREGQRRFPGDFWVNHGLGMLLYQQGPAQAGEAGRYLTAAVALRSQSPGAHLNLGVALKEQGKLAEAVQEYYKAIDLDPKYAAPHVNLGLALEGQGKLAAAVEEYHKAISLGPEYAAHVGLANALKTQGRLVEAVEEFQKAIALNPRLALAHGALGSALWAQGKLAEAVEKYHAAIFLDPKDARPHVDLGSVLRQQGKLVEAVEEFHKAIALDPKDAKAHGALGEALLQRGDFAEAVQITRRCVELLPPQQPLRQHASQQLQRCEAALALSAKLPAILRGDTRPADAAEALTLAQLCQQYKQLHVAAERLYAEAFAADPKLAADLSAQHRYNAACSAALAAAGQGKDADKLGDKERQRLRRQALEWLRADLDAWSKRLADAKVQEKEAIRKVLQHWQQDTDLAAVRDGKALSALPADESDAWKKLWADVAALFDKAKAPR
jgi:tetratricopeptide (TPR) repeat protein